MSSSLTDILTVKEPATCGCCCCCPAVGGPATVPISTSDSMGEDDGFPTSFKEERRAVGVARSDTLRAKRAGSFRLFTSGADRICDIEMDCN